MMRTVILSLVVIAFAGHLAAAKNCNAGLNYCGFYLLYLGNYQAQIEAALQAASLSSSDQGIIANTLFSCLGGTNGDIKVIKFCDVGCIAGAIGQNDVCRNLTSVSSSTISSTASSTSPIVTTTVTQSSSSNDKSDSNNSPTGAIVGGVIGGVALVGLIGLGAYFIRRKTSLNKHQSPTLNEMNGESAVPAAVPAAWKGWNESPTGHNPAVIQEAPTEPRHELHS